MKFPCLTVTISTLFFTGLLLSSCKKEEVVTEKPKTDYLGNTANSFTATVDGTPFNENLITSSNTNGRIVLTASRDNEEKFIRIYFPTAIAKGTYSLEGPNAAYRGFYIASAMPGEQYSTSTSSSSTLTITGHDTNNDVLIGDFSLKPITDTNTVAPNEIVEITGQFAINY